MFSIWLGPIYDTTVVKLIITEIPVFLVVLIFISYIQNYRFFVEQGLKLGILPLGLKYILYLR